MKASRAMENLKSFIVLMNSESVEMNMHVLCIEILMSMQYKFRIYWEIPIITCVCNEDALQRAQNTKKKKHEICLAIAAQRSMQKQSYLFEFVHAIHWCCSLCSLCSLFRFNFDHYVKRFLFRFVVERLVFFFINSISSRIFWFANKMR